MSSSPASAESGQPDVGLRPPVDVPQTEYAGIPHEQLEKQVNDKVDLGAANEIGQAWTDTGKLLVDFADELSRLVTDVGAEWEGEAGLAAREKLAETAGWTSANGQAFQHAGQAVTEQGAALEQARNAMPKPVEYDPWKMLRDAATSPTPDSMIAVMPEIYQRREQHVAAHEEAVRVMNAMDTQVRAADSTMPSFAAAPGSTPPPSGPQPQPVPQGGNERLPAGGGLPGVGGPGPVGGRPSGGFGSNPGALAAEKAVARGAGIARGAAAAMGTPGVPGMGAGRGQAEQDREHRRPSYLVEDDPEGLFGTDEPTVPPVLGG